MGIEAHRHADLRAYVNRELLTTPEKPLAGQTAIISGALRMNGIGYAIAERFAVDGASNLILIGTENSRDIASFAQERLERYGTTVYTLIGDVTEEDSVRGMMHRAYEIGEGKVHILVNNAGTNVNKPLLDVTTEDWHNVMDSKALGAFLMTREWFDIHNQRNLRGGTVINIGSVIGIYGNYGQAPYESANASLIGLTKGLALELGNRGITVNAIAPMFVEGTDMTADMSEQLGAIRAATPLGTLIEPQDIAGAAAFLAGPDGRKLSGVVLPIDCGAQSNYAALLGLHRAGFRQVPRAALGIIKDLTPGEIQLIKDDRAAKKGGQNV